MDDNFITVTVVDRPQDQSEIGGDTVGQQAGRREFAAGFLEKREGEEARRADPETGCIRQGKRDRINLNSGPIAGAADCLITEE